MDRAADAGGHALGWAVGHGYSAITGDKDGGRAIEGRIDRAADRLFFDGHAPAGDNPADIYAWFHGPQAHGTGDYAEGENDLRTMAGTYQECETHARNAQAALRDGWKGSAAEAVQQTMTPIVTTVAAFHQHATTRQNSYGSQIPLWDHTKNSVVLVPKDPPQANPLMLSMAVNPMTAGPAAMNAFDTDRHITTYQHNAQQNQQAFNTYQPPTQQNAATIPQQPGPVDTGRSDTGTTPPPPGGGVQPPPRTAWRPGSGGGSTGGPGGTSGGGHVGSGGDWTPLPGTPGYTGPGDSTGAAGYLPPTTTLPAAGTFDPTGGPTGGGADYRPDGRFGPAFGPGGGAGYGPEEGSGSVFGTGGGRGAGSGRFGAGAGADGGRFSSGAGAGTRGPGNAAGAAAEEEGVLRRGGVAGRPGAAGAPGAGGMGAGGRGGRGEEDREHRSAAYLVSEDNGNEIVGNIPLTAPPVIGE
jgi:hypothetical protein